MNSNTPASGVDEQSAMRTAVGDDSTPVSPTRLNRQPEASAEPDSHSAETTTKISANEERIKAKIMSFDSAVSERYVGGMNEFRSSMRQTSRQAQFDSVWFNETGLQRLGVSFKDPMANCLYLQMYYQHYFEQHQADPDSCVFAITNMSNLFMAFNSSKFSADISAAWLWSIIDEFISLYEALQVFKSSLDLPEEVADTATPLLLLNPLQQLMQTSKVLEMLEGKITPASEGNTIHKTAFMRALGYYSVVGLIRYHAFEGDYAQALQLIDKIPLNLPVQRMFSGHVYQCILATNFYSSFCLLIARRYLQCVNILCEALHYILDMKETEQKRQKTVHYLRKMCHTLALVLTIFPIRINEHIFAQMQAIVSSAKYNRLQEGDANAFSEVFLEALPSCPYNFGADHDLAYKNKTRELNAFMTEAQEQICFLRVRNILVNYSSISIEKLAACIHKSEQDALSYLLSWKHRLSLPQYSKQEETTGGGMVGSAVAITLNQSASSIGGSSSAAADVIKSHLKLDFYIDGHMVYISHVKPADKYTKMLFDQYKSLKALQSEHRRIKFK